MTGAARAGGLALAAAVLANTAPAEACGTCGAGDPTLTATGTEQPYAGRLRSVIELRYRTDKVGRSGIDAASIRELRTDLIAAWSPHDAWFLTLDVPVAYREVSEASLARTDSFGLADVEVGAKWIVARERSFAPRWQLGLLGGLELPTSGRLRNAQGELVPAEAQSGSRSLDVLGGAAGSLRLGEWTGYLSAQWLEPALTRADLQPGRSLRASLALQYQPAAAFALRLLSDARQDQPTREHGERDPNSGGFILFSGPELLLRPAADALWVIGVRQPVLQRLDGAHSEGAIWRTGLALDW